MQQLITNLVKSIFVSRPTGTSTKKVSAENTSARTLGKLDCFSFVNCENSIQEVIDSAKEVPLAPHNAVLPRGISPTAEGPRTSAIHHHLLKRLDKSNSLQSNQQVVSSGI